VKVSAAAAGPHALSASGAKTYGATTLPASVDLRASAPAVGDQGQVSSCVAWTVGYSIMGYYANTTKAAGAPYAPLYLYLQALNGGTAPNDGLSPETALKVATSSGVDTQVDYPQGTTNYKVKPTAAQIANAANYKVTSWTTLWSGGNQGTAAESRVKQSLAAGQPVGLGIPVYSDFENLKSGTLYNTTSGQNLGGHMVTIFGYDSEGVWIRNQWGTSWGTKGDAHLSWNFVDKAALGAYTVAGIKTPAGTTTPTTPTTTPSTPTTTPTTTPTKPPTTPTTPTKPTAPSVTKLSVTTGKTSAQTVISIAGTNLGATTRVTVDGRAVPFQQVSGIQVLALLPTHAAGPVHVQVTTAAGTSIAGSADVFTYLASGSTRSRHRR
jgi:hypothetical protein